jgi:hypothetical protein
MCPHIARFDRTACRADVNVRMHARRHMRAHLHNTTLLQRECSLIHATAHGVHVLPSYTFLPSTTSLSTTQFTHNQCPHSTHTWRFLPHLSPKRYVFGGRNIGQNYPHAGLRYTQIYNPETNSWSLGPQMRFGRGGMGTFEHRDDACSDGHSIVAQGFHAVRCH